MFCEIGSASVSKHQGDKGAEEGLEAEEDKGDEGDEEGEKDNEDDEGEKDEPPAPKKGGSKVLKKVKEKAGTTKKKLDFKPKKSKSKKTPTDFKGRTPPKNRARKSSTRKEPDVTPVTKEAGQRATEGKGVEVPVIPDVTKVTKEAGQRETKEKGVKDLVVDLDDGEGEDPHSHGEREAPEDEVDEVMVGVKREHVIDH